MIPIINHIPYKNKIENYSLYVEMAEHTRIKKQLLVNDRE